MPELREFASNRTGDRWYLARDDQTMLPYVVIKTEGGAEQRRIEFDALMLQDPPPPEREALFRLIATLVEDSIDNIEYTEG